MALCEQLRDEYLKELRGLISSWKEKSARLISEGSEDEAIFETIRTNVGEIFCTLLNVSYGKSCKNNEAEDIKLRRLSETYFDFFVKIPAPWKEKMAKDKEYNMMDEYYKEQIKLETAELIKNMFIKYYDKFCEAI